MIEAIRRSPVKFATQAQETEKRGGWTVVLSFAGEGDGPCLVDLSHRARYDFQDGKVAEKSPLGLTVPAEYNQVSIQGDMVINRMNRTQVAMWHLGGGEAPALPEEVAYTDTTDSTCMLAVVGKDVQGVMECVSNLDLFQPGKAMPNLVQGTIMHIPCQVAVLGPECVVFTFSRGYGQNFADEMLHAAHGMHLRPGGEKCFTGWWAKNVK